MDLTGKAALVTGAGRRIGRTLALALADAGCKVGVHYSKSKTDAEDTASLIRSLGGTAITLNADLELTSETCSLAERMKNEF